MPGIILAAPSGLPSNPNIAPWTPMRHVWSGWNGTDWDLTALESGVALLQGVRGLSMPAVDRFATAAASVPGSRWQGNRTTEREVFWPLKVWSNAGSSAWVEYDRAFWATMRPDRTGVWTVTQPSGEARSLTCRFVDDGSHTVDLDPALSGWARYGVTLVAEWPYWQGTPVVAEWAAAEEEDFYGGTGGPPFFLSSGHTLGNATVTNPGDVESWPTWTLTGPFDSASLGVGDDTIDIPFAVADGVSLTVDSDPWGPTARLSTGEDKTGDVSELGFAPIPPGEVPLTLELDGTGSVSVSFQPNFYRAW